MAQVRSPGGGIQRVPISDCAVTDMHQKQEAIGKTAPPGSKQKRYQPPDPLLEFLENL